MNKILKNAFKKEIIYANDFYKIGCYELAFTYIERAHILGQSYVIPHFITHWWMFKIGLKTKNAKEVLGQIPRMIAAFLVSKIWVPIGNTGGVNVSPFKPMPVPQDLKKIFEKAGKKID
ncbi:DUF3703 domain-containing protein [Paraferrimonas sp. SM1919]|uniref:DUF3703 domain-containing protein n=1 Tax=Paraferrimonas sp. SM1919 TaxID=2662263 RepID=UPI0013D1B796|nr:DUF3703 domain-containing protein [Paraferrimonas sp. SM1919]